MIRKGFKMFVYPDKIEAYTKRHNPIWTELQETLKQHGVSNYSIFLDKETNTLFGYTEVATEAQWEAIANTEVCKKWWNYMADLMETNKDNSPVSHDLESVFYL
jgi:L-rhamnose mutarotase|tara:strand:- start:427 stop:738 length:312 start_codon:yes stop_codon:yes gene_type:complete